MRESFSGPTLPAYSRLDGGLPGHARTPSKLNWTNKVRKPVVWIPTLALLALVVLSLGGEKSSGGKERGAGGDGYVAYKLHDSLDRLASWQNSGARQPAKPGRDSEWFCNPFDSNGRLAVDLSNPANNIWTPYDSRCPPSNLMSSLYRPPGDASPLIPPASLASNTRGGRAFLPWFVNRTVLLHGDSIDRFHLKDFCEFVGGILTLITPDHPACPPMWRMAGADEGRRQKEDIWEGRPREGWELTNPWVCDVKEYGATLINVFTWGLEGAEKFFETERWYYPPATWTDRMDHIALPLLSGLAKHYKRPQIERPDLVILNSGYWDLRRFTEEDFVSAGFLTRPYPEDSPIPYTPLSRAREEAWEHEARKAIKHAARSFKGKDGRAKNGPTILWRSLHHPPRHNYAPFPRVFALDSLSRKVISDLRLSQSPPLSSSSLSLASSSPTSPSALLSPSSSPEPEETEDLGLSHRLRIDESGRLLLGQEHLFRDLLHPLPTPGSWLWGDVMLYELKRAVDGIDR
ncbi:hypothetical protein JCM11251_003074 [Rhodosporidiobolus azoricus]